MCTYSHMCACVNTYIQEETETEVCTSVEEQISVEKSMAEEKQELSMLP